MSFPDAPDFVGTARFRILRRIGAGGMGVVYEAHDLERNEHVALKTLARIHPEYLSNLKQEFRALTDVIHPNLVALHELFSDGEQWFFTMELVRGVSFLNYVGRGPALDDSDLSTALYPQPADGGSETVHPITGTGLAAEAPDQVVPPRQSGAHMVRSERLRESLIQLAEGICALHAAGKLHRDIKPSNVLVTNTGRVVLLDFGLVMELEHPLEAQAKPDIAGTRAYMSPEQAAGRSLSPASDWYAVGVMLYEALTGVRPFSGSRRQVMRDKQRRDPLPPRALDTEVPVDLDALCMELLQRRPEARPAGTDILARLRGSPIMARVPALRAPAGRAPFVGRERHLEVLWDGFRATRKGRTVTVYVHGPSGVGKSLLVQRFLADLVEREQVVVLAGRCYERESVPYKALDSLVDALGRYLGQLPLERAVEVMPREASALARLFPVLRRVALPVEGWQAGVESPDPQELRRRAFAALRQLLTRLGSRQPTVLAIDDLQWGDVDSAALLADLLRPPDPPVLMLVGSYRSEYAETSPCLLALRAVRPTASAAVAHCELAVEPLALDEARHLALELLGPVHADAVARASAIARESGGNPYFVHELTQHVRSGSKLTKTPSSTADVRLDEVLWERVCALPEGPRRLLEVVTVSGRPLRQGDAYRAAALGTGERAALAALRAGHLVRSAGPGDQDEVETFHDRIRETVVAHLPAAALRDHHHRLAAALEASSRVDPETLAVHLHGAGEPAKAGHYYALAAGAATDALAFDRAAKLYRLSLDLRPVSGAEARALQTKLGDALANAGRGLEAAREYQTAAAGASAAQALELQRRAAMQSLISGHVDEGLVALRAVFDAVQLKLAPTPRRALLSLLWRRTQLWLRGLHFHERDLSQLAAEELTRIDVCWSAAVGLSIIDTIRGAEFQTRNLLLSLRAGEPYRVARALAWEAAHVANTGGPMRQRTARLLAAAEALARRIDHPHALGLVTLSSGIAAYMEGRWPAARELSERAEEIFRSRCTGVAWELDTAHSFSFWSLFFLGEVAELRRRLPVLLKEAQERGDLYAATNLATFVGHLTRLAADDPDGARQELHEVMHRWSQQGFHVQHLTGLMGHLQIEIYRGDGAAAWQRINAEWPALKRSLFLRVQTVRIFMLDLRARSALAAAAGSARVEPFLRAAEQDARRIERERMPWSEPLALLIRAGVATIRNDQATALALVKRAASEFDAVHMGLFAAVARRRQGELQGDEEGRALVAHADAWMANQRIDNPIRMTALHAPGFPK